MPENILIEMIDEPIYTRVFHLHGTQFGGHEITVYAQCEENFNREGDNDHYNMSFFFDADGYGAREFLLQVSGGNHTMTQQEMDKMIVSWMNDVIVDDVLNQLDRYLLKEHLYEQWLDSHAEDGK